jgi:hypothetical protein
MIAYSKYSDPKTMAMAECKPLAWTETNEGCNPSRISLAPPIEFPTGINMFSSREQQGGEKSRLVA